MGAETQNPNEKTAVSLVVSPFSQGPTPIFSAGNLNFVANYANLYGLLELFAFLSLAMGRVVSRVLSQISALSPFCFP